MISDGNKIPRQAGAVCRGIICADLDDLQIWIQEYQDRDGKYGQERGKDNSIRTFSSVPSAFFNQHQDKIPARHCHHDHINLTHHIRDWKAFEEQGPDYRDYQQFAQAEEIAFPAGEEGDEICLDSQGDSDYDE